VLITSKNLCQYLLSKDFVSAESIVGGDFEVADVSGRNRNFKVSRKRGPGFFIKQIQNWNAQAIAMLQCETACYWLAREGSAEAGIAEMMPKLYWYDQERHILITELIEGGEDLFEQFRRLGIVPAASIEAVGSLIGKYHRESRAGLGRMDLRIFPKQKPWILCADRRRSHPFKELSAGTSALFDRVENSGELRAGLDRTQDRWRADVVMHGDLRWENCIITGEERGTKMKLVDWELADVGDACWDVGSIMQSFLSNLSACAEAMAGSEPLGVRASLPALRILWQSYVRAVQVPSWEVEELLDRCVHYAAARMVQTAYEYLQFSHELTPRALRLLALSSEIYRDTETLGRAIRMV
jgi:hypothetical protein